MVVEDGGGLHRDGGQSEDLAVLLQTEEECRVLGLVSEIPTLGKNIPF